MRSYASRARSRRCSPCWRSPSPARRPRLLRRRRTRPVRAPAPSPRRARRPAPPATGRRRGCGPRARSTSSSTARRVPPQARSPAAEPVAGASFRAVSTPDVPPYSYNGRVFIRRGGRSGYCSGTAIDSPTRQLVLSAGHCLNSGHEDGKRSVWSDYLQFVPAYDGGLAPFGAFVARRNQVRTPRQWTKHGNPDFDLGAFLTLPNAEGVNVADAVGGGAAILTDLTRHQDFLTFGYPGQSEYMQKCSSPYIGDDLLSNPFPGPPTLGIRCHWAPGASGGGWLIGGRRRLAINGINAYLHLDNRSHTFGPYFPRNRRQLSALIAGPAGRLCTEHRRRRAAQGVDQAAVEAVVAPVRAQVGGQGQVVAGAGLLAGHAEGAAEAEVGVVVDVVGLDHGLELDHGLGEAAGAVVGAAQRLAHRGLLRRPPRRLGQRLGGIDEVAVFEQLDAAPVQRVGLLLERLGSHPTSVGNAQKVPKSRPKRPACYGSLVGLGATATREVPFPLLAFSVLGLLNLPESHNKEHIT